MAGDFGGTKMITKEKFLAYLKVQKSGKTNMFDVNAVIRLSHYVLDREDCIDIMKNYSKYKTEFVEGDNSMGGVF